MGQALESQNSFLCLESSCCFPWWLHHFRFPQQFYKVPFSPLPKQHLLSFDLLIIASSQMCCDLIVFFICVSLVLVMLNTFTNICLTFEFVFLKNVYKILCNMVIYLCTIELWFSNMLYIVIPFQIYGFQIFSPILYIVFFILLMVSGLCQNFSLMQSHIFIFCFCRLCFWF